jgi:phosphoenolpyruvate carboxykinase (ATP)
VEYRRDPVFGFEVPTECAGIPAQILDPAASWPNREEYARRYNSLAARFIENFKLMSDGCPASVLQGGPKPVPGV